MAVAVVTSAAARNSFTADASPDLAFGAAVPAAALLVCAIYNNSDETTTITSVTDTVNGAWTVLSGPTDHPNTTMRTWFYGFANSGAGTPTVTVNFSGAINTQIAIAAFSGVSFAGAGACGSDVVGTPMTTATNTTYTSNSIALSGAGVIVSGLLLNSGNTITMGSDEVNVTNANSRAHIMASIHATSATRTHVASGPSTTSAQHIAAWLEASSAVGGTLVGGKLVGGLLRGRLVN